jgi:hypothetical protein
VIGCLKIFVDGAGRQFRLQAVFAIDPARPISVRRYQTGINAKAVTADPCFIRAALQDRPEQLSEQAAFADTAPAGDACSARRATYGGKWRTSYGPARDQPNRACKTTERLG